MMRRPVDGLTMNMHANQAANEEQRRAAERQQFGDAAGLQIFQEDLCVHSGWISPRLEGKFLQLSTVWQKRYGKVLQHAHDPNVLTLLLFDSETSSEPRVRLDIDVTEADFQLGTGLSRKSNRFEVKARLPGRQRVPHRFEFAVDSRKELAKWAVLFGYREPRPSCNSTDTPATSTRFGGVLKRSSSADSTRNSSGSGPSIPSTTSSEEEPVRGVRFDLSDPTDDVGTNADQDEVVPISMSIGTPNLMFFPSTISMVNHAPPAPTPAPSRDDSHRHRRSRGKMSKTPHLHQHSSSMSIPTPPPMPMPSRDRPTRQPAQESYVRASMDTTIEFPTAPPRNLTEDAHREHMTALLLQSFKNLRDAERAVATSSGMLGDAPGNRPSSYA